MKKIIILIISLIIIIILATVIYFFWPKPEVIIEQESLAENCQNNFGTWLNEWQECEKVTKEWCKNSGGVFFECESACRHNPKAEICTLQCIQVCKFGEINTNPPEGQSQKDDLIIVDSPAPDSIISSPLTISGQARGNWYFEASFPVVLADETGAVIAQTIATAKSDWMTEDFVPFESTITFEKPLAGTAGTLILKKDNPSGLAEYDDELVIPIIFE